MTNVKLVRALRLASIPSSIRHGEVVLDGSLPIVFDPLHNIEHLFMLMRAYEVGTVKWPATSSEIVEQLLDQVENILDEADMLYVVTENVDDESVGQILSKVGQLYQRVHYRQTAANIIKVTPIDIVRRQPAKPITDESKLTKYLNF